MSPDNNRLAEEKIPPSDQPIPASFLERLRRGVADMQTKKNCSGRR